MRWAVFLRGVNVGGHRVTKDELIAACADAGLPGATTFLASGNIVVDAPEAPAATEADLIARIERAMQARLGYAVPTLLRPGIELAGLAVNAFFTPQQLETGAKPQLILLPEIPEPAALAELMEASPAEDLLVPDGRSIGWLPREGVSTSELDLTAIGRAIGPITVRTFNTIERMRAKFFEA